MHIGGESLMEYLKKEDVVNALVRLKDAREQKKNCSKQTATEYAIFGYILKVIDTLKTYEKD